MKFPPPPHRKKGRENCVHNEGIVSNFFFFFCNNFSFRVICKLQILSLTLFLSIWSQHDFFSPRVELNEGKLLVSNSGKGNVRKTIAAKLEMWTFPKITILNWYCNVKLSEWASYSEFSLFKKSGPKDQSVWRPHFFPFCCWTVEKSLVNVARRDLQVIFSFLFHTIITSNHKRACWTLNSVPC